MSSRILSSAGALLLLGGVAVAAPDSWELDVIASNGVCVAEFALRHPTLANHRDWTYGVFYSGLVAFALAHPDLPYLETLREEGRNYSWRLDGGRPFFAETHCIGQAWLELARHDDSSAALAGTRGVFDYVLENRSRAPVVQRTANGRFSSNPLRWSWCDALFMSPPVWAKLASLTGEDRYRDFLIGEYRATIARLYDREHNLFYRDFPVREKRSANSLKVFWGRGNGWVLGGLPLVIRELPPHLKSRPLFVDLYREMCAKVKTLQREDGAWGPNLLDGQDPDLPEMSVTSLFCYALMWGVNEGLLDEADYLPTVKKAWSAMCRNVSPDGALGWVQQAATGPAANYGVDSTALYAVGGYLLAATEIRKHLICKAHPEAKRLQIGPQDHFGVLTAQVRVEGLLPTKSALVVFDERDGSILPSQLWDEDADGVPDMLLFRVALGAGVPRVVRVFSDPTLRSADRPVKATAEATLAFVREGRSYRAGAPSSHRVVVEGPVRSVVEYEFPPVDCGGGVRVTERRRVQQDRMDRFALCRSEFSIEGAEEIVGGPVLSIGEGETVARPRSGWMICAVEEGRSNTLFRAVCTRAPSEIQTAGAGELALVRHLTSREVFIWQVGEDSSVRGACVSQEQWSLRTIRALEEACAVPVVR